MRYIKSDRNTFCTPQKYLILVPRLYDKAGRFHFSFNSYYNFVALVYDKVAMFYFCAMLDEQKTFIMSIIH